MGSGLITMLLLAHKNWCSFQIPKKNIESFTDFYVLKEASKINCTEFKQANFISYIYCFTSV